MYRHVTDSGQEQCKLGGFGILQQQHRVQEDFFLSFSVSPSPMGKG